MFILLCKRWSRNNTIKPDIPTNFCNYAYLQIQKSLNYCSISQKQLSPTVSYLTQKCGVPLDSAIKVSQKIKIKSTKKTDSVLQLFKYYGFTQNQIIKLVASFPTLLLADPVKNLQPKFEFFGSLGLSKSEVTKIVSSQKRILRRSLTNEIIPTYNFLKRYLNTDKDILTSLVKIQCWFVTTKNFHSEAESNIEVMKKHGVPDFNIRRLLMTSPRALSLTNDKFKEILVSIEGLKLDLYSLSFSEAIGIMGVIGKSGWDNRIEAYKLSGWSEEDVISAFKLQPRCMVTSEKKIGKMMDFYVNELGLTANDVIKYPNLMMISLEDRVIPRCSVLQVLVSKGLIKKDLHLMVELNSPKNRFEKRFVEKYKEEAPEVLKAYKGELGYPRLEVLRSIL